MISSGRLRPHMISLVYILSVSYVASVALNILFRESGLPPSVTLNWCAFFGRIYAEAANALCSISLVWIAVLWTKPLNWPSSLGRVLFFLVATCVGGVILLNDILMFSLRVTPFPFYNQLTYMLVDAPWYLLFGTPDQTWSIILHQLVRGLSPLITMGLLALVLLSPNLAARRSKVSSIAQTKKCVDEKPPRLLYLHISGLALLLLTAVPAVAAISYFAYSRTKAAGFSPGMPQPLPSRLVAEVSAQTAPVGYLPAGTLFVSEEVSELRPPPEPPTLRGSAISLVDDHFAVLTPATKAESSEGFWAFFHLISLSGEGENVAVPILFPRDWSDESARKLNIDPFSSGPFFSRGRWYVSFTPYSYQAALAAGENPIYGSAIYSFPPEGGIASEWFPPCAPRGVVGFAVHDDAMYLVPALDFADSVKCLRSRSIPMSEVVKITLKGVESSRFPIWVNTTLTGEPFQSLDMRVAGRKLYILHRPPAALPLPDKGADESVDKETGIDLIDLSRIDVYTSQGDWLSHASFPLASYTVRYFSMDMDEDSGLVLVVGAYTGYAYLYAMRPYIELDIVAEYWNPSNCGMHGTEDFVLNDGKVYVPGSDGERSCILVYDLGWPD